LHILTLPLFFEWGGFVDVFFFVIGYRFRCMSLASLGPILMPEMTCRGCFLPVLGVHFAVAMAQCRIDV
jgi:hypothetical protein